MLPIRVIVFGIQGIAGPGIYSGAGAPDAETGRDGGFYIDTTAWQIYGPKTDGAWGDAFNIQGPKGDAGEDGEDGTDATVNAGNVLAAILALDAGQLQQLRAFIGILTYANLAAANLQLADGDPYFDSGAGKLRTATN
jgi:hypothetical protein